MILRAQHMAVLLPQLPSAPARPGSARSTLSRRLGPLWYGPVLCPLLATGPHIARYLAGHTEVHFKRGPSLQPRVDHGTLVRPACSGSAFRLHPQLPGAKWQNPWMAADKQQRAALPPRLQGPSLLPSQLAIHGGRPVDAPAPPVPLSSRGLPSPVFCVQISFF